MEAKLHVIELKLLAMTSILLPRKLLFFEPEILQNGRKFEPRINIKIVSVIWTYIKWSQPARQFVEK